MWPFPVVAQNMPQYDFGTVQDTLEESDESH